MDVSRHSWVKKLINPGVMEYGSLKALYKSKRRRKGVERKENINLSIVEDGC